MQTASAQTHCKISLSLHQPLLRYMTDGKRWGEEDSILCSFYKCPFTPYPVLYVVSLIHFTTTTTTPCDPQVAAHTQNFSVRLSERKRDTFFSYSSLFFSITPSLALDGKCTRGRGWGNIRGKEGRGKREIGKDVLWIKEVEVWKRNVTVVRKRLNPVCLNNRGVVPESTQDGGQRSFSDENMKRDDKNHLRDRPQFRLKNYKTSGITRYGAI